MYIVQIQRQLREKSDYSEPFWTIVNLFSDLLRKSDLSDRVATLQVELIWVSKGQRATNLAILPSVIMQLLRLCAILESKIHSSCGRSRGGRDRAGEFRVA